jgi:hypothetical protein
LLGSYELADCGDEFFDACVGLPEALVDYTIAFSLLRLVPYEILFDVDIQVAGRSRVAVIINRIAADDQIVSFFRVQQSQELAEVAR